MTASARGGRPPLTDAARLLAAARELGIEALTVGKVTEAVGVKYSTFYRHFATLDDLLVALVDEEFSATAWPAGAAPDQWREHLTSLARVLARLADRCPGIVVALDRITDPSRRPTRLREVCGEAAELLVVAGLDEQRDVHPAIWSLVTLAMRDASGASVALLLDGLAARLGGAVPS